MMMNIQKKSKKNTKTCNKMDVINVEYEISRTDNGSYFSITVNDTNIARGVKIDHDENNCKISYAYGIEQLIYNSSNLENEFLKEIINKLFSKGNVRIMTFVTVMRKSSMEFIKKNFDCMYINRIPFGDDNGMQYHIMILNPEKLNFQQRNALNNSSVKSEYVFEEKGRFELKEPSIKHRRGIYETVIDMEGPGVNMIQSQDPFRTPVREIRF